MVKTVGKVFLKLTIYPINYLCSSEPYTREHNFCRPRKNRTTLFYFNGNLGSAYEGGRPEDTYVSMYLWV